MKYIDFDKIKQNKFMKNIKSRSQLSWDEIAKRIKISRSMIFFYLNGYSKIPIENYKSLCLIGRIKPKKEKTIEINNKTRKIKIKRGLNKQIAELLGALAGDGHISDINYEVSISGNKELDFEYLKYHLGPIFMKLFGIEVKIKESKISKGMKINVNSKNLVEYLKSKFNIPSGKKKGKLQIPSCIKSNKYFLKYYIKGLFDTDGSIYLRRGKPVISIISRDPLFLKEVGEALNILGFKISISGKNLYIYSKKEVILFFKKINPMNKKHIKRYNQFANSITLNL